MFSSEEFLTASQVAGFFSRLAAKKSLFNDDDLEEEIECATQEATIEELTNKVSRELFPGHPILWDKYNPCFKNLLVPAPPPAPLIKKWIGPSFTPNTFCFHSL